MRELKFRGKCVDTGEWVYGNYFIDLEDFEDGIIWIEHPAIQQRYGDHFKYSHVHSSTVGQYTGLKDKNGKEIFEGDIARVFQPFNVPTKAIVEFNDGCFELKGIELTWRDYVKCFVVNHAIEIIGNIHENPKLL